MRISWLRVWRALKSLLWHGALVFVAFCCTAWSFISLAAGDNAHAIKGGIAAAALAAIAGVASIGAIAWARGQTPYTPETAAAGPIPPGWEMSPEQVGLLLAIFGVSWQPNCANR